MPPDSPAAIGSNAAAPAVARPPGLARPARRSRAQPDRPLLARGREPRPHQRRVQPDGLALTHPELEPHVAPIDPAPAAGLILPILAGIPPTLEAFQPCAIAATVAAQLIEADLL